MPTQQSSNTTSSGSSQISTSIYHVPSDSDTFFGSFLQKKGSKKPGVLEPPPNVLKASGSLSEREYYEIEVNSKDELLLLLLFRATPLIVL